MEEPDELAFNEALLKLRSGDVSHPMVQEEDNPLARAYSHLRLSSVPVTADMDYSLQHRLTQLRCSSQFTEPPPVTTEDINKRLKLVIQLLSKLIGYQTTSSTFLYVAETLVKNMYILKGQLKCTYLFLPWEEMLFCLTLFISSQRRYTDSDVFFRYILKREDILKCLNTFFERLNVYKIPEGTEPKTLASLGKTKFTREQLISSVTSVNGIIPEDTEPTTSASLGETQLNGKQLNSVESANENSTLKKLYSLYRTARDMYSLEMMKRYIDEVIQVQEDTNTWRLAVKRTLQVVGELLKDTPDSPNLSPATSDQLLQAAPPDTRLILKSLRDSLSHEYNLTDTSVYTEENLYSKIQNDLKKIGNAVSEILFTNRVKEIRNMLTQIIKSDSLCEINIVLENLRVINIKDKLDSSMIGEITFEDGQVELVINDIGKAIIDKTDFEVELFRQIKEIIIFQSVSQQYRLGYKMLQRICLSSDNASKMDEKSVIRHRKHSADFLNRRLFPEQTQKDFETQNIQKLKKLLKDFYDSVKERYPLKAPDIMDFILKIHVCFRDKESIKAIDQYKSQIVSIKKKNKATSNNTNKITELEQILKINECIQSAYIVPTLTLTVRSAIEISVLDLLTDLDKSLAGNLLYMDDNVPLLTGRCLRNYLAHGNHVVDILFPDTFITVLSNARWLIDNKDTICKNKFGHIVNFDAEKLQKRYYNGLDIIKRQEDMLEALNNNSLKGLEECIKEGADIHYKSVSQSSTIHIAAAKSKVTVEYLSKQLGGANLKDVTGQTALHIAAANGRYDVVQFLIVEEQLPINETDNLGRSPLHFAAQNDHVKIVELLIDLQVIVDLKDTNNETPLLYAIYNNSLRVVKLLFKDFISYDNDDPILLSLHSVAELGYVEMAKFLISKKFNVNGKHIFNGQRPLHVASTHGYQDLVNLFIQEGADVNLSIISNGCSPLHCAAGSGNTKIVETLLEHGARVDARDSVDESTPLHMAVANGSLECTEVLLMYGANINLKRSDNQTPLQIAARMGHIGIEQLLIKYFPTDLSEYINRYCFDINVPASFQIFVKAIIEMGIDTNSSNIHQLTPQLCNFYLNEEKTIIQLLDKGADVNWTSGYGRTLLHLSALKGYYEICKTLIDKKADVKAVDNEGLTSLHYAALKYDNEKVIELLLNANANVDLISNSGLTPLHFASMDGCSKIVKMLLEKGKANMNARDSYDYTALHIAMNKKHKAVVEVLLNNSPSAEVNGVTKHKSTALLLAIKNNWEDIVKHLIRLKATVDSHDLVEAIKTGNRDIVDTLLKVKDTNLNVNIEGSNLLHIAVVKGNWIILKSLIKKGTIDINATNKDGYSPLSLAVELSSKECVVVLLEGGANTSQGAANTSQNGANTSQGGANTSQGGANTSQRGTNTSQEVANTSQGGANTSLGEANTSQGGASTSQGGTNTSLEQANTIQGAANTSQGGANTSLGEANTSHGGTSTSQGAASTSQGAANTSSVSPDDACCIIPEHGGSHTTSTGNLKCLLHIAISKGNLEIIKLLFENINNFDGKVPITLAAIYGQLEVIKYLFTKYKDIDVDTEYTEGYTLLHFASAYGQLKVVEYLIQKTADLNILNTKGLKPIHEAIRHGHINIVKYILEHGMSVTEVDIKGITLLHYAALFEGADICQCLLNMGADVNALDIESRGPIHLAAIQGNVEVLKILLQSGGIYNEADAYNNTPIVYTTNDKIKDVLENTDKLFQAVENNDLNVEEWIKKGASLNAKNVDNWTLLHIAAEKGFKQMCDILLKNKANPNVCGAQETTPLHCAAISSSVGITKALLASGAMYNALNYKKQTPLDLATDNTIQTLLQLVNVFFENVKSSDEQVAENGNDLVSILDSVSEMTTKSVLNACNTDGKTVFAIALLSNYPKRMELMEFYDKGRNLSMIDATKLHLEERYQEALICFDTLLHLRAEMFGCKSLSYLDILKRKAKTLYFQSEYTKALKLFEESYYPETKILGENNEICLETLTLIAQCQMKLGKCEEAETNFSLIHQIQKDLPGSDPLNILWTTKHWATCIAMLGRWDEALQKNNDIYETCRSIAGPMDPLTLSVLNNIGMAKSKQGKHREAFDIFEKIYKAHEEISGVNNSITLTAKFNMAAAQAGMGYLRPALDLYQQVYACQREHLGSNHSHTLNTEYRIALIFASIDMNSNEGEVLLDICKRMKSHWGPEDPKVLSIEKHINAYKIKINLWNKRNVVFPENKQVEIISKVASGDVDAVNKIIRGGCNVNIVGENRKTALHTAAERGSEKIVKMLLDDGADPVMACDEGSTGLHYSTPHPTIILQLLQHAHKKLSLEDFYNFINSKSHVLGVTALHMAASKLNLLQVVRYLLQYGASYDILDKRNKDPSIHSGENSDTWKLLKFIDRLFRCAVTGDRSMIEELRRLNKEDIKATVMARNKERKTTLEVAIEEGHIELAMELGDIQEEQHMDL